MCPFVFQSSCQIEVVLEVVLLVFRIQNIARVVNGYLGNTTGALPHGLNTGQHGLYPVERIEDAENIVTAFPGFLNKLLDKVIGIRFVAYCVGTTNKHL